MPTGLNGQPVLSGWNDPALVTVAVPGSKVRLTVHKGWFQRVAAYVAWRWHNEVEPLKAGQCWGFDYRPARAAGGAWSSHSTGYAIDLNSNGAGSQLWGDTSLKATPAQLRAMAAIKKDTGLLWGGPATYGGDYSKPSNWDPMHWDLPKGVDAEAWCKSLVQRLRLGADGRPVSAIVVTPPPAERGPQWYSDFLTAQGMSGSAHRIVWTLAGRESAWNPAMIYPAGAHDPTVEKPPSDWGALQINSVHLNSQVRRLYGSTADMRAMLDPLKNLRVARELSNGFMDFRDWGIGGVDVAGNVRWDWSRYPQAWLDTVTSSGATQRQEAEANFLTIWRQYKQPPSPAPNPTPPPVMQPVYVSLKGVLAGNAADVMGVQRALNRIHQNRLTVDGKWGPATQRAYDYFRRADLHLVGAAATGKPGINSLTYLGQLAGSAGFKVKP